MPFFGKVGALSVLYHLLQGGFKRPLWCLLDGLGDKNPAFARDTRADLLLVYMLILAREAELEVKRAAVTNEAWPPRKAFFVGWRRAGLLM